MATAAAPPTSNYGSKKPKPQASAPHNLNDPWFHLLSPTLPASQEVDELVDKREVAELNVQMPQPFSASAAGVADSFPSLSALPAPRQLVERGISVT